MVTLGASLDRSTCWPFHNSMRSGRAVLLRMPAIQDLSWFCTNKMASNAATQLGSQIEKQCHLVTSTLIAYTYIDQLALRRLDQPAQGCKRCMLHCPSAPRVNTMRSWKRERRPCQNSMRSGCKR